MFVAGRLGLWPSLSNPILPIYRPRFPQFASTGKFLRRWFMTVIAEVLGRAGLLSRDQRPSTVISPPRCRYRPSFVIFSGRLRPERGRRTPGRRWAARPVRPRSVDRCSSGCRRRRWTTANWTDRHHQRSDSWSSTNYTRS